MSKPAISKESEVLLKLIRIALGTERDYTLPADVNWQDVIRLSYEHKVSSLAVDGLRLAGIEIPDKSIAKPWLNDVEKVEQSYVYYLQVLNTLCQIFKSNGIKPIILKGYGLSLNYPIPSHRGAGDIDLFILDKDNKPAGELADDIARRQFGLDVEVLDQDGHSHCVFKGIKVEIHHRLISPKSEKESLLQDILIAELCSNSKLLDNTGTIYVPSATFNAIFMVRHIAKHFAWKQMEFRQLTDWTQFIRKHSDEIDWNKVQSDLSQSGLMRLAAAINGAAIKHLNLDSNLTPFTQQNSDTDSIMQPLWHNGSGLSNFAFYYMNRGRNSLLTNEHWLIPTFRSIKKRILCFK